MHQCCLVTGGKAENGVCNEKAMFITSLEKQQAATVALSLSVLSNHAFPGSGVSSNSRIKVTKTDKLVGVRDGVDDIVEVLIELVFSLIWIG